VISTITGNKAPALRPGRRIVSVDPAYYRPTEVPSLLGDAAKAHLQLGWTPATTFAGMVREMIWHDLIDVRRDKLLARERFQYEVSGKFN